MFIEHLARITFAELVPKRINIPRTAHGTWITKICINPSAITIAEMDSWRLKETMPSGYPCQKEMILSRSLHGIGHGLLRTDFNHKTRTDINFKTSERHIEANSLPFSPSPRHHLHQHLLQHRLRQGTQELQRQPAANWSEFAKTNWQTLVHRWTATLVSMSTSLGMTSPSPSGSTKLVALPRLPTLPVLPVLDS